MRKGSVYQLRYLIELKLASGTSNAGRLKDLSDVLELIKVLDLPLGFADQLDPFVQSKYGELWKQARSATWRPAGQGSDRRDEIDRGRYFQAPRRGESP